MTVRMAHPVLLVTYGLLWLGGVGVYCLGVRSAHTSWGGPAFLVCAALLAMWNAPGARTWLLAVAAGDFLAELLGAHTGFPFGPYSYSPALQPQLAGVPAVMSCAWVVLIAYVKSLEAASPTCPWRRVAAGALGMVLIDLAIEPVAAGPLQYWRWCAQGLYYGVPCQNFFGWFLVSALLLACGVRRRIAGPWPRRVGLSVVLFFGLLGACHGALASPLVATAISLLHYGAGRRLVTSSHTGPAKAAATL
ncbi:MAG: carotenoid biosynthesis protein [Bryobacteraceae bacterium]